ncbi:MAG: M56 family metallopeptidase, partial [Alphaproteobacteria bacterium]|nr:M56 family metallopeptidase [Alphaproteobacteria bacterium]
MDGSLLALSILGVTVPVAAAGFGAGLLVEKVTPDAVVRERFWTLAFLIPVVAAAAVPLAAPFLERPVVIKTVEGAVAQVQGVIDIQAAPPSPTQALSDLAALLAPTLLLSVLIVGIAAAGGLLVRRHIRLALLVRKAGLLEDAALSQAVSRQSRTLKVRAPLLKTSDQAVSPMLAGLLKPAIIMPRALTHLPTDRLALICGHELAHLKRGDNLRGWLESVLLAVLWFNPFAGLVHARMAAAREERCDAIALDQASPAHRRAYAESLVETLRLRAGPEPQSAFIGAGRKTAMRLKAILKPHDTAGRRALAGVASIAVALTLAAGAGSVALATQAAPVPSARAAAPDAPEAPDAPTRSSHSQWRQSAQNGPGAPKGEITVTADTVTVGPENFAVWSGNPVVKLRAATG